MIEPRLRPPLDEDFRPASLAGLNFREFVRKSGGGVPLLIALERPDGAVSRHEASLLPPDHPQAAANLCHAERLFKFLLWQRGGCRAYLAGPAVVGEHIRRIYSDSGERSFDSSFMGEEVYGTPFSVTLCRHDEIPAAKETGRSLGRHLDGCRIGFDLGASDRKVAAVIEGREVFSQEVVWEPKKQSDPEYHFREIVNAIEQAAAAMPRLDAIGGSAAGIYIDNRVRVASLFRGVPKEKYGKVRDLFLRVRERFGVPLEVINDGDVTALAGSMSIADNRVLGIALGSSLAAGYVNSEGNITGWLNELAFAPIDYSLQSAMEDWSGDRGCGATYLSQQCVFRLAPKAGIQFDQLHGDAEKLQRIQEMLANGHEGALRIWETLGTYLGYAIAHYDQFYELKHILILGRCMSGKGGEIALQKALAVLRAEFPEEARRLKLQLPGEKSRRIGQAIAAASLPAIGWERGQ